MSKVTFFCAICGSVISTGSSGDSLVQCPDCAHVVPVPAPMSVSPEVAEAMNVLPEGVLALEVKFRCTSCSRKLQIDARMEGRWVECPNCNREARVPVWSRRPPPTGALTPAELDLLTAPIDLPLPQPVAPGGVHAAG